MATNSSAKRFRLDLEEAFKEEVEDVVVMIHKKIAMTALTRVVMMSPVDTGRFRGNWTVAEGKPNLKNDYPADKGGNGTISREAPNVDAIKGFTMSWLSNNVPYAEALENGHSKQAPGGMVAITFTELSAMLGGAA